MAVRKLTLAEARDRRGLIGVINRFGQVTYYAVYTVDEWRHFVRGELGYY